MFETDWEEGKDGEEEKVGGSAAEASAICKYSVVACETGILGILMLNFDAVIVGDKDPVIFTPRAAWSDCCLEERVEDRVGAMAKRREG